MSQEQDTEKWPVYHKTMQIINRTVVIPTKGVGDIIDITDKVKETLRLADLKTGSVSIFVKGSTASVTTLEYEPGLVKDMRELAERLAPSDKPYHHDDTWADKNGFSHIRASIFGPSVVIPFTDGEMFLGRWQQIVLAEFDVRSRHREIFIQIIGESQ